MSSPAQASTLPTLKKILFPTDFSECSRTALLYACTIARLYSSTVQIVHVIPPEPTVPIPMDNVPPALDTVRAAAESAMAAFMSGDAWLGIAHAVGIERGPIWGTLAALIQLEQIDLIVLGTHGRRGWRKLVLGSVAEQIFRQASCPVLTVGPQTQPGGLADGRLGRILYATDFSAGSVHAFTYAQSLAERSASRLILLHVVQDSVEVMWKSLSHALVGARSRLQELLLEEAAQRLRPEIVLEQGPAADKILKVAGEKQVDLIVMGAHRARMPAATAHLPWAVASAVVSLAHCPVLTVRS